MGGVLILGNQQHEPAAAGTCERPGAEVPLQRRDHGLDRFVGARGIHHTLELPVLGESVGEAIEVVSEEMGAHGLGTCLERRHGGHAVGITKQPSPTTVSRMSFAMRCMPV